MDSPTPPSDLFVNFCSDLFNEVNKKVLRKNAYLLDNNYLSTVGDSLISKCHVILTLYIEKRNHRLRPLNREVFRSRHLHNKLDDYLAHGLSLSDVRGVAEVERKSIAGIDLFCHYNKCVARLPIKHENQDKLFNDWNILHFHLGPKMEEKREFIDRSRFVLMVYPTDNALYFLDIYPHDQKIDPDPWYKKELVEIIHSEWPDIIAHCRMPSSVLKVHLEIDDQIVQSFRGETDRHKKAAKSSRNPYTFSLTYPLQTQDGTPYFTFGGGLQTNGFRTSSVRKINQVMTRIKNAERFIVEKPGRVRHMIYQQKGKIVTNFKVAIKVKSDHFWDCRIEVFETTTGTILDTFSI